MVTCAQLDFQIFYGPVTATSFPFLLFWNGCIYYGDLIPVSPLSTGCGGQKICLFVHESLNQEETELEELPLESLICACMMEMMRSWTLSLIAK